MTSVYFDFETGGIEDRHPNIQLAAVAVDADWNELAVFEQKIRFDEADADPEALRINHYTAEAWRDAKPSDWVAAKFSDFLRPFCCLEKKSKAGKAYSVCRLFAHNGATFDGPRLRRMFTEARVFLPADMFIRDTLQRALWWFEERGEQPASLRLTELCKLFDIATDGAHDALTDVRLSIALAQAMKEAAIEARQ